MVCSLFSGFFEKTLYFLKREHLRMILTNLLTSTIGKKEEQASDVTLVSLTIAPASLTILPILIFLRLVAVEFIATNLMSSFKTM